MEQLHGLAVELFPSYRTWHKTGADTSAQEKAFTRQTFPKTYNSLDFQPLLNYCLGSKSYDSAYFFYRSRTLIARKEGRIYGSFENPVSEIDVS